MTVREPNAEEIAAQKLYKEMGVSETEYESICEFMGRKPNYVEVGIFSVMWSEHCSYKNSRPVLAMLPTTGERVLVGPGEGAGVVDIGDGQAVVFKIESHNHPSAIEPFQGAATGVGGILRDIFSMGARPVALLNSLRFGPLDVGHHRYLFEHVVEGIAAYGNCIGVPTVGGEVVFDEAYSGNPLVNVMCVGLIDHKDIQQGRADGIGNPVFYVGPATGRDGIHGATFASEELTEESEARRPAVQVGDPFKEKLVMEACLELIQSGIVVGIQDMGAAGLTCSSTEMASKAGNGMSLHLDRVPQRARGMTAYEMMLSESQERMLFVVKPEHEDQARKIFEKWDLPCVHVGNVTDDGRLKIYHHGEVVGDVPVEAVVDQCPVYTREVIEPKYYNELRDFDAQSLPAMIYPEALTGSLEALLASPTIASKRWIYEQFDSMVGTNTLAGPGGSAAVIEVEGTKKGIAMTLDGNGRWVYLDPFEGGKAAVAEAARNLVSVGALPLAVTDNLNYGNPEKSEIYWQLHRSVAGMAEACKALNTPVIGGNVSLYNEHAQGAIYPTPVVGMVGLLEDFEKRIGSGFREAGDVVLLLGETEAELGGSAYLAEIFGETRGAIPRVDLEKEKALQTSLLAAIRQGLIRSAQDCSDGGLAVALAEKAIHGKMGATLNVVSRLRPDEALFSETTARVVISVAPDDLKAVNAHFQSAGVPIEPLGKVGGEELKVKVNDEPGIISLVSELQECFEGSIPGWMSDELSAFDESVDDDLDHDWEES